MSNKISSKKKTLSIVGGLVVIGSIIAIVCGYYGVQNVNELNDKFIQDVNESITKLKDELKTVVEKKYYFQGFTSSDKTGELCLFVSETDLREKIDKIDPKKEVDGKIMESGDAWKGKDTIKFPANALDNLKYEYKQPALFSFGTWFKTSLAEKFGDLCKKYKGAVGDVTKKFVIVTLNDKNIKTYQVGDDKKCAVQTIDMEWATEKLDVAKVASFILVLLDGQQKGENGEPSNLQKMEKIGDEKPVDKKEGETENNSETPVTPKEIEPKTPTAGDKDQNVKDAGKEKNVQDESENKGEAPKSDHSDDVKKPDNAGQNDSEKANEQSKPVNDAANNSAPGNEEENVENQNNGEKPSGPEIKEVEVTPTNPEGLDKQQLVDNEAK